MAAPQAMVSFKFENKENSLSEVQEAVDGLYKELFDYMQSRNLSPPDRDDVFVKFTGKRVQMSCFL